MDTATDPAGSPPRAPGTRAGDRALYLTLAAAASGTFVINLDATIVTIVLPSMQDAFGLPFSTVQWAVTAYLLVIAGLLPLGEQLTVQIGRRRVLVLGLGAFTVGSALAALSPVFGLLILARVVQGLGAAMIQVNVMAIVALTFPKARRGQALGLIGSVVAAGTLAGPSIGAGLSAAFGWRAVFWATVPVGVLGMVAMRRYIPSFPADRSHRFRENDWTGAALFLVATALLQLGLSQAQSRSGLVLLLAAALVLTGFLAAERRHRHPLIELALFRVAAFSRNLASGFLVYALLMFPAFLLPFYIELVLHQPTWVVGLSLVPQAVAGLVVAPLGGRMADRTGVLGPIRLGFGLLALADLAVAVPAVLPLWAVWALSAATGVAGGLIMAPNNTAILGSVPRAATGLASAVIATQRNLGRNVGTAVAALVPALYWMSVGAGAAPAADSAGYPALFGAGFRVSFVVAGVLALLGPLLAHAPVPTGSTPLDRGVGGPAEGADPEVVPAEGGRAER
jgi:EmrB/QacA subfamily drug resistance transporter